MRTRVRHGTADAGMVPAVRSPITVRDARFGREARPLRWWVNGDPIATAWHNSLSASFPRGEAMFIEAVKAYREDAPPDLAGEIRAFVRQEVNHSREHLAFNRMAEAAAYDLTAIDKRVAGLVAETFELPRIGVLGVTIALEHFTAMFAHEFLAHPRHFAGVAEEHAALWRWHAVEEIEHKAVAYDTWLHATRSWRRTKRWRLRSLLMLIVTARFIRNRSRDALELLAQDGIGGIRVRARLAWYLLGKPGILRRILPQWCAYFRPGFHPWKRDNRELVEAFDTGAILPGAERSGRGFAPAEASLPSS